MYGVDGEPITMFEVFQPFTSERCPALHHKPKFFIINACRGGKQASDKGFSEYYFSYQFFCTKILEAPSICFHLFFYR